MITRKKVLATHLWFAAFTRPRLKMQKYYARKYKLMKGACIFFLSLFCQYTKHCSQQRVVYFFSGEVDIPEKVTFSIHGLSPLIILVQSSYSAGHEVAQDPCLCKHSLVSLCLNREDTFIQNVDSLFRDHYEPFNSTNTELTLPNLCLFASHF